MAPSIAAVTWSPLWFPRSLCRSRSPTSTVGLAVLMSCASSSSVKVVRSRDPSSRHFPEGIALPTSFQGSQRACDPLWAVRVEGHQESFHLLLQGCCFCSPQHPRHLALSLSPYLLLARRLGLGVQAPLPCAGALRLSLSISLCVAQAQELIAATGARGLHIHAPAVASEEALRRRQAAGPFAATSEQAPPATVCEDLHLLSGNSRVHKFDG